MMERLYGARGDRWDYFFLTEEELLIIYDICDRYQDVRMARKIRRRLVRKNGDLFFSLRRRDAETLAAMLNDDRIAGRMAEDRIRRTGVAGVMMLCVSWLTPLLLLKHAPGMMSSRLVSMLFVLFATVAGWLSLSSFWAMGERRNAVIFGLQPLLLLAIWFAL